MKFKIALRACVSEHVVQDRAKLVQVHLLRPLAPVFNQVQARTFSLVYGTYVQVRLRTYVQMLACFHTRTPTIKSWHVYICMCMHMHARSGTCIL